MELSHIVKKPVVTEKSLRRMGLNQYTFEVHADANKAMVAEAVADLFGVTVFRVKIMNRKGKEKRVLRKRHTVTTATKKLAIVTIDPKDSIDLFSEFDADEVESQEEEKIETEKEKKDTKKTTKKEDKKQKKEKKETKKAKKKDEKKEDKK